MQGNYWVFQIVKNERDKVCLKFYGRFYVSIKHLAFLLIYLVVIGSVVSSVVHYL